MEGLPHISASNDMAGAEDELKLLKSLSALQKGVEHTYISTEIKVASGETGDERATRAVHHQYWLDTKLQLR